MTEIGTLFVVGLSVLAPLLIVVAAGFAAAWLSAKACACKTRDA